MQTERIPDYLCGTNGVNRAAGVPCQIRATTDLSAIHVWLNEFSDTESTFRSYRKEIERFYNWALRVRGLPLSSLTREDLSQYQQFMASPTPTAVWCGPRNARRGTPKWRPFEKGLLPNTSAHAMTVIGSLFSYLVQVRYLSGNPLATRRRRKKNLKDKQGDRQEGSGQKFIPLSTLRKMLDALEFEANAASDVAMQAKFERMLFITRFLASTGLRRDELACSVMSNIFTESDPVTKQVRWYMRVHGKGDVVRDIALIDSARDALYRYRKFYNLSDHNRGNHSHLLLPLSGARDDIHSSPMTGQTVYKIVVNALAVARSGLAESDPEDAMALLPVTPHWFRHTFATVCLQMGYQIKHVQEQLGHASIEKTAIYQHAERQSMYDEFSNLVI